MLYKLSVEEAPTLKDLLDQVAAAIDGLGKDAQWTGYEDGCIYAWRKDKDVGLGIKPNTKANPRNRLTRVEYCVEGDD